MKSILNIKNISLSIFAILFLTQFTFAQETNGTITARKGNSVTMKCTEGIEHKAGDIVQVQKHFENTMGKMVMTGWLNVASAKVKNVAGEWLVFEIIEEQSTITVNGEKVDHFKIGNQMKLTFPEPEEEEIEEVEEIKE